MVVSTTREECLEKINPAYMNGNKKLRTFNMQIIIPTFPIHFGEPFLLALFSPTIEKTKARIQKIGTTKNDKRTSSIITSTALGAQLIAIM